MSQPAVVIPAPVKSMTKWERCRVVLSSLVKAVIEFLGRLLLRTGEEQEQYTPPPEGALTSSTIPSVEMEGERDESSMVDGLLSSVEELFKTANVEGIHQALDKLEKVEETMDDPQKLDQRSITAFLRRLHFLKQGIKAQLEGKEDASAEDASGGPSQENPGSARSTSDQHALRGGDEEEGGQSLDSLVGTFEERISSLRQKLSPDGE